jgi:tricorn protease
MSRSETEYLRHIQDEARYLADASREVVWDEFSEDETLPAFFDRADRGPLIGTRTWGGLIGITGAPTLVDGGGVTVPTFRQYGPDGEWFPEGRGVTPDIRVENTPAPLARGEDPQLRRAIQEMTQALEDYTPAQPERPPYEDRTPSGSNE